MNINKSASNSKSANDQDMLLQERLLQVSQLLQPRRGKIKSTMAPGQRRTMCAIHAHGQTTQIELLEELELAPATLSEFLVKLEHKGYIAREKSQSDGRVFEVKLTDEGTSVVRSFIKEDRAFAKRAFSGMSAQEKQQLSETLQGILDTWDSATDAN